ncbi:MAG: hypothetical protein VX938_09580, partial [Myxococcota bacterium]|nr:hypothetical protein [Myxococcota bacterium]
PGNPGGYSQGHGPPVDGGSGGDAVGIRLMAAAHLTVNDAIVEVVRGGDGTDEGWGGVNGQLGYATGVSATDAYGLHASRLMIRDIQEGQAPSTMTPDSEAIRASGVSLVRPLGASFDRLTVDGIGHDLGSAAMSLLMEGPKGQADNPIPVTNSIFSGIQDYGSVFDNAIRSSHEGWVEASYNLLVETEFTSEVVEGQGVLRVEDRPYVPGDDALHIRAGGASVDAGDPTAPYENEPEPNGGRMNMGYYGNTVEASVAPGADKTVEDAPCAELPWVSFMGEPSDGAPCGCMNLLPTVTALGEPCEGLGVCGVDSGTGEAIQGEIECGGGQTLCSTGPGGTGDRSGPEVCDQLDNNCDG